MNRNGMNESDKTPEQVYDEFWKEIIEPNGVVDMAAVKKELYDYAFVLDQVPKVYMHVTGGAMSKPNYYAGDVIREADDHATEVYEDNVADEIECYLGRKITLAAALKELDEWRTLGNKFMPQIKDTNEQLKAATSMLDTAMNSKSAQKAEVTG